MLKPPQIRHVTDIAGMGPDEQSLAFDVSWVSPGGKAYAGQFVHRCPTVGETVAIDVAFSKQAGRSPLSELGEQLAWMIAHLDVTLKARPDWAKPTSEIPYVELLRAVAEEAAAHVRRFCGRSEGEEAGPGMAD